MGNETSRTAQVAPLLSSLRGSCILITGASGLVGATFVRYLMELNAESDNAIHVIAAARNEARMQSLFLDYRDSPLLKMASYDVGKSFTIEDKVDYIVHAASPSDPRSFSSAPADVLLANILGTHEMLELARSHGAKLLFVSTGEVYGPNPRGMDMLPEVYYGSVNALDTRSCYPEGKRASETLCASYCTQFGVSVVVARLCYVFGELITEYNSRADAEFLRKARQSEDIVLKSDGAQKRSYCYADDAVAALLFVLVKGANGSAYNIANRSMIMTIREYAQALANAAGVGLRIEEPSAQEKAGYSKSQNSILDPSCLEALGWRPYYSFSEAINRLLAV